MNRYAQAVERLLPRIDPQSPGIGIVMVPPGQHALIAEALRVHLPGAVLTPLQAESLHTGPPLLIVTGLPKEQKEAELALTALKDRRGWIASQSRLVVLLLTRRELSELQRFAADVYSAQLFLESVAFIPDPAVNEEEARVALAQWYQERLGRLDLRGFVRSESEDVSWSIEDIYQDVQATLADFEYEDKPHLEEIKERRLIDQLTRQRRNKSRPAQLAVILGSPGSGKTFFLRWLATQSARSQRKCGIDRPVPLLVSFSAYAQAPGPVSLLEYLIESLLEAQQPAAHCVEHAIAKHRALFLLDGLDEAGDASMRKRMAEAVNQLSLQAEGNLIVVTSRIAGYKSETLAAIHFALSPFDDEAISDFLIKWCDLYARDQSGDTAAVRQRGQEEGRRLADDVLGHPQIHELARSPLLLTVLAIVQRAGVRLPDHRVELYEHATRILVERWNRVRSHGHVSGLPPIKVADAVRLLGPVAVEIIRKGTRGAIPEEELRELLQRSVESGQLRGVFTAEEALHLFRYSLGLLVEQSPGLYSFLHLTLAEYFAARELVRTHALEQLAADPKRAFLPQWREVILLAAGELGVNRADDVRLESLVKTLLESASQIEAILASSIASLLGGLLSDDAGLSLQMGVRVLDALIPKLWFDQEYEDDTRVLVVFEARRMASRIRSGRFADEFRSRLNHHYVDDISSRVLSNRGMYSVQVAQFLDDANADYGPFLLRQLPGTVEDMGAFFPLPYRTRSGKDVTVCTVTVSRWLHAHARAEELPLVFWLLMQSGPNRVAEKYFPWKEAEQVGAPSQERVELEIRIPSTYGSEVEAVAILGGE